MRQLTKKKTSSLQLLQKYSKIQHKTLSTRTSAKPFAQIPGPRSLPLIGTLYKYLPILGPYSFEKLHINGIKKLKQYGPIVREEIVPGVHIVWLFKPEDIETMFRCEGKYPQRRSHLALEKYRLDRPTVYNTGGLLPTNGETWYKLRKVFQKGLSSPVAVQHFVNPTDEVIQEWFGRLDDVSMERKKVKAIKAHDYMPELARLFLEITGLVALDLRLKSFSHDELHSNSRSSKLMRAALTTNSCILKTDNGPQLWRKFETPLYRKMQHAQRFMEDVAIDLLSLKMSLFDETMHQSTLLDNYLASPELDFKDIIGMVCDFLLAGIDTSTYTTSFLLYNIAKNPHVQNMIYDESLKLLRTPSSPVTIEVLSQAHYTKAVLKESLRLRPISIGIGRILNEAAVFSNYEVPEGTVIVSQNQVACRLDENFPAAHEFKPERWLKDHALYKPAHPFLLIPFGHGPRSCIARRLAEQSIQILTLKLIRNYKVRWVGDELDSRSVLINQPDGPINLVFEKR